LRFLVLEAEGFPFEFLLEFLCDFCSLSGVKALLALAAFPPARLGFEAFFFCWAFWFFLEALRGPLGGFFESERKEFNCFLIWVISERMGLFCWGVF
jgi:hypothetical protein